MKQSLLDLTQDILSDMNSDEVSSVTDTVESMQVAQILKSVYEEMMGRKNWPHLRKLTTLNSLSDTSMPSHMAVPENIKEVCKVSYNKKTSATGNPKWQEVIYLTPDEFLVKTNSRNTSNSDTVEIEDVSGAAILIKNDKAPQWYTSFDDTHVVFDSYDSALEGTLQENNTQVLAYMSPSFTLSDTFVPDLPAEAFPAYLAEAKSTCFARIKQAPDQKSEQQARRSQSWISQKSWQVSGGWQFPDYGRRGKK